MECPSCTAQTANSKTVIPNRRAAARSVRILLMAVSRNVNLASAYPFSLAVLHSCQQPASSARAKAPCNPHNYSPVLVLDNQVQVRIWRSVEMSLASLITKRNSPLLLAAVVASGLFFAGCDEHVDVVRDHSVAIPKHATWAWRPAPPPEKPDKK